MLKVFILLSFLLTANSYSLRSEASEMSAMKKMISLMQSQINLLRNKEGISKVGEIRYSTLRLGKTKGHFYLLNPRLSRRLTTKSKKMTL